MSLGSLRNLQSVFRMINPVKIVVCFLKSVKTTPQHPKRFPDHEYLTHQWGIHQRVDFKDCLCSLILVNDTPVGFSLPRNGSEQNSEDFSLPRNGSEHNSEGFLFREMVWNGIPRIFLFWEMVWNCIPRYFSSAKQAEFWQNCCLFRLVMHSAE